jgi:hypothetical protein
VRFVARNSPLYLERSVSTASQVRTSQGDGSWARRSRIQPHGRWPRVALRSQRTARSRTRSPGGSEGNGSCNVAGPIREARGDRVGKARVRIGDHKIPTMKPAGHERAAEGEPARGISDSGKRPSQLAFPTPIRAFDFRS